MENKETQEKGKLPNTQPGTSQALVSDNQLAHPSLVRPLEARRSSPVIPRRVHRSKAPMSGMR